MAQIDIAQGSPDWFAARRGLITGTGAAAVQVRDRTKKEDSFGQTAMTYALKVATDRLCIEADDDFTSAAMQRGKDLEPDALDAYEDRMMVEVGRSAFFVHDTLALGFSPDGLVQDGDGDPRRPDMVSTRRRHPRG